MKRRKAVKKLAARQRAYDASPRDGYKRPGSMNGTKS